LNKEKKYKNLSQDRRNNQKKETLETIMLKTNQAEQVIQRCNLQDWQRADENWISPGGKIIPVSRLSQKIKPDPHDEGCSQEMRISIWSKNVSIEIVRHCGFNEVDFLEIELETHVYRISKVSHDNFIENHDEIIANAYRVFFDRFRI
jgi:hypothetical protein